MNAFEKLITELRLFYGIPAVFPTRKIRIAYMDANAEITELLAIKEAAWKLIEHPDSEAKKRELARLLGVEL